MSLPRRGTFVSGLSVEEARSVYEIRVRLEPYAIERAVARLADEDVAAFAADLKAMREAAAAGDLSALTRHDMRFHGRFYDMSGSELARAIWRLIETKTRTFIAVAGRLYFESDEASAIAEMHAKLLELIDERDTNALQVEVERQLLMIWDRIGDEVREERGDAGNEGEGRRR